MALAVGATYPFCRSWNLMPVSHLDPPLPGHLKQPPEELALESFEAAPAQK
jgi:hypothetical protein